MYMLGEKQELTVTRIEPVGAYLGDHYDSRAQDVLLPKKWVPEGMDIGDKIEVFVYKDSEDRPIATTMEPKITLGGVAVLTVVDVTKIGAFLDWGLEKDLLLPFHEQSVRVRKGDECLVTLYLDKSERFCASMTKVYHALATDSPYKKDDQVDGFVYEITEDHGVYVAVDDKYTARIAPQELRGKIVGAGRSLHTAQTASAGRSLHTAQTGGAGKADDERELSQSVGLGQRIKARVARVLPDGKLDLTLQKKIADQMADDADAVLAIIERRGGSVPFTDKADPAQIMEVFSMSKNAFKRAVGRLLKNEKIEIGDNAISLTSKNT